jgi:predicted dehydrogenase
VTGRTVSITTSAETLIKAPEVEIVFIANSDEYHTPHIVLALQHDKQVFVEKPMCLNIRDADQIIAAERKSKARVMVGYMRRYASAFTAAIKEIGGMEKITYTRVRGLI